MSASSAGSAERAIPTICGFCLANCGIIAYVRNGVLRRVKGNPNHPTSGGYICPKGAAARQVVYSPGRLKYPLRKTKDGFQRISWDDALDIVATKLLDIREKHGAETLIRCGGSPVTQATWDAFVQLVAAYGSINFTGASHLCSIPRITALNLVYGGRSAPDYKNTRCMLVWGSNPTDSRTVSEAGVVYGKFTRLIPEAKRRGAKLIVVDPRRIDLVDIADKWIAIEPGTDAALALAMLHTIINEGLYDKEFVAHWTVGFEELAKHVGKFTADWAQNITRVPASDIREVARIYATTKPAIIREGNFIDQSTNAIQTMRAIAILSAITGNVDVPGGDIFFPRAATPFLSERPAVKILSADKYPLFPMIPFPFLVDAILNGQPYQPRAMIVYHGNPLLINANSTRTKQALERLEFLVVCDIFKSATAELADIILPDASDFESFGVRFKANTKGGFVALQQKVIEPVGECRPVFEVEYELAKRMGLEEAYPWTNTEECINHRLRNSGITLEDLKKQPVIYTTPPVEYRKYLKKGFNTPSGKVEIYSQRLKEHGYAPLPEYREPADIAAGGSYPLIGTTRRPGVYTHTRFRNIPTLRKKEPEPSIRICPHDAQSRGIKDGDPTVVESAKGSIEVKAMVTPEVSPGVVIIDFGWGNPWDQKANVNVLTSDEVRDPISGSTANRRFRCQVTKASS